MKYGFNCFERKTTAVGSNFDLLQTNMFLCANKIMNLQCIDIISNYNEEIMPSFVFSLVIVLLYTILACLCNI